MDRRAWVTWSRVRERMFNFIAKGQFYFERCICVYMLTYIHICSYIHVTLPQKVWIYLCLFVCMYICIRKYMYLYLRVKWTLKVLTLKVKELNFHEQAGSPPSQVAPLSTPLLLLLCLCLQFYCNHNIFTE